MTEEMIDVQMDETLLSAPVAPEDIRAGDYIAPMNEVMQFVLRGCEQDWIPGEQRVPRLHLCTMKVVETFPSVMRVLAVGLPFVLVEQQCGTVSLVTCRLSEFARLPVAMGKRALREVDRKHREETRKRRKMAADRRDRRDRPGAGAAGAD
jgi:hypothetical protein